MPTLTTLSKEESREARAFFDGPGGNDRAHSFIGWMINAGNYSATIGLEIRRFQESEKRRAVSKKHVAQR